jgi:O-methyltransferase
MIKRIPESRLRPFIVKLLQVTRLNKLAHKIYYGYVHGFGPAIPSTLTAVERSLLKAKETGVLEKGDYYEFGIFKGYTFMHAQELCNQEGIRDIRFFGFDSFAGLPNVEGVDETSHNEFYKGQYKCQKDRVVANLESSGVVDWDRTFLIEGYFDQSLTDETRSSYPMNKVAIALVDCDLYSSTVDVLAFIRDMLVDGSIVLMDDWNAFNADDNKGQRLALSEFLAKNPGFAAEELFSYPPYGQVFIMRIQNQE